MTRARRPHPPGRPRPRPARAGRRATACCSSGRGWGWPGGASRRGCRCRGRPRPCSPPSRSTTRSASRARGRWPSAPSRSAPTRRRELVIPEVVWGRADDGTRWVTTIGPRDAPPIDPATLCTPRRGRPPAAAPAGHRRGRCGSPEWWCELVARATKAMRDAGAGGLDKVVLAREVAGRGRRALRPRRAPAAACGRPIPGCFLFHVDGFLGASPELLVGRAGDVVRAQPMAGTAPRGGDPAADARLAAGLLVVGHLPARAPDHDRHGVRHAAPVVLLPRLRAGAVGRRRRQRAAPGHPGRGPPVAARPVGARAGAGPAPDAGGQRLAPRRRPRRGSPSTRASTAAATPAPSAGSTPRQRHLRRRASAAPTSTAPPARVVAGNGIVADSDPDTELAETQVKLQALLSALTRV